MGIISQRTRKEKLIREMESCRNKSLGISDAAESYRQLGWQIYFALMWADIASDQKRDWEHDHPACNDHEMRSCPLCRKSYDQRWDIPAPAVQ